MGDGRLCHHGMFAAFECLLHEPWCPVERNGRHRVVELFVCTTAFLDVLQGENYLEEGKCDCGDNGWSGGVFLCKMIGLFMIIVKFSINE